MPLLTMNMTSESENFETTLVTGGCGFIGQRLVSRLVSAPDRSVRVLDNLSSGKVKNLEQLGDVQVISAGDPFESPRRGVIQLIIGDIRDADAMVAAGRGVGRAVHFAANSGVAPSVADPRMDFTHNALGIFNVLESCRLNGIKNFVFASSSAAVGDVEPPIHELVAPHPVSPYGASKMAGEAYCSAYWQTFGVAAVALRFGNVYGPGSSHKESVVARFVRNAMTGVPLDIYGDGEQTRDFIYLDDLIDAVLAALVTPGAGGEVFQIATARGTTLNEMVNHLLAALEAEGIVGVQVNRGAERLGDVRHSYADTSKAERILGWKARTPLAEGLRDVVRWFVAQRL